MNMDEPLGWDKKAKEERDKARDKEIARVRIGDLFSDWKSRLCKRARSRREIIQSLYDLQKLLDEARRKLGENADDVFPWKPTAEMIANKIATLTAVQICSSNTAVQHLPATVQMRTDGIVVTAKRVPFRTIKEFGEIDFVRHFSEQPGFKGFYAKMAFEPRDIIYYVIAQYENDACIACELENDVLLDDFAQYDESAEAAQARTSQAAQSADTGASPQGGESTQPPPRGTRPADGGSTDIGEPS